MKRRKYIPYWVSKKILLYSIYSFKDVKTSANIHMNDVNFNHIIEHALLCTLEEDGEDVSSCVGLRFGTID